MFIVGDYVTYVGSPTTEPDATSFGQVLSIVGDKAKIIWLDEAFDGETYNYSMNTEGNELKVLTEAEVLKYKLTGHV